MNEKAERFLSNPHSSSEEKDQNPACVCTIDGLVDKPVTHRRRLRWIPGHLEAGVPLLRYTQISRRQKRH